MPRCNILSVSIQFSLQILTASIMTSPVPAETWYLSSHNLSGYSVSHILQYSGAYRGERRYFAQICKRLDIATDTFSSEKTFKCNQCGNDFRCENCLKIHVGREHVRSGETICLDVFSHFFQRFKKQLDFIIPLYVVSERLFFVLFLNRANFTFSKW